MDFSVNTDYIASTSFSIKIVSLDSVERFIPLPYDKFYGENSTIVFKEGATVKLDRHLFEVVQLNGTNTQFS